MLGNLKIKIFADGADLESIKNLCQNSLIKGFTTNPSLMKKKGITDYKKFALNVLEITNDKPVSFEIFADDLEEMEHQANEIATWGNNVNVKIPVTNTQGKSTVDLIAKLSEKKIICNVTAILTLDQLRNVVDVLNPDTYAILSIFAGRIADSGIDPIDIIKKSVNLSKKYPNVKILWASPREVINIFQANEAGCHIITVAKDIIDKFENLGKNLEEYSLDTVKMFYKDALKSKFKI